MIGPTILAALLAVLLVADTAVAQQRSEPRALPATRADPQGSTYAQCLQRAGDEPSEAIAEASAWLARGGGDPARHCLALALFYGGRAREAAQALEDLAQGPTRAREQRAELLAQASRAWFEADQLDRALAALTMAQSLAPRDVDLLVDRAEVLAAAGRLAEAITDLDRAAELGLARADVLVLRAAIRARRGELDLALRDATRAIELAPRSAEAHYERGRIHRTRGDRAAARADWLRALAIERNGAIADATRRAIQEMETRGEEEPRR